MVHSARFYWVLILAAGLAALLGCRLSSASQVAVAPMPTDTATPPAVTQPLPTTEPPSPTSTIILSPTLASTPDWDATQAAYLTLYPATPTHEPPCEMVIRTPPPDSPTVIPPDGQSNGRLLDPHVAVCTSPQTVHVGDELVIMAHAVDIGLPIYSLAISDTGQPSHSLAVRFDPQNETVVQDTSQMVDFVRAEAYDTWDVIFVLTAAAPGALEAGISASGEIHYGYPGPAMWSGGGSGLFTLTIEP